MGSPLTGEEFNRRLGGISAGIARIKNAPPVDQRALEEFVALYIRGEAIRVENDSILKTLRQVYGYCILIFLWVYFLFTAFCIIASAVKWKGIDIPSSVLAALVGGTAVSVIGVVGTVAAGLFRLTPTTRGRDR